jgi:hypothetical protein
VAQVVAHLSSVHKHFWETLRGLMDGLNAAADGCNPPFLVMTRRGQYGLAIFSSGFSMREPASQRGG